MTLTLNWRAATAADMTPSQQRKLEWLKREILLRASHGKPEKCEFKRWEIQTCESRSIYLYSVVGMKGDEGTLAQSLARDKRNIAIGPKGRLELLNSKKKPNATGSAVVWSLTN